MAILEGVTALTKDQSNNPRESAINDSFGAHFELEGTMPKVPDDVPQSSSHSYTDD